MEQLYYILDIPTNTIIVKNLTYQQATEWLEQNGIASDHVATPH
jgi:hypothetical protein